MSRYDLAGKEDGEFEPGSNQTVLKNKLGIVSERRMQIAETNAYYSMAAEALTRIESSDTITVDEIRSMHRAWLEKIYSFAGEYRTSNISKGGFMFCAAPYVPKEMDRYAEVLSRCTPCEGMQTEELAKAMAEVHGEFILIHPFREGNGRLGRWMTTLMALQAGYPILSFAPEREAPVAKDSYFAAVRRYASDETDLTRWFSGVLERRPRF